MVKASSTASSVHHLPQGTDFSHLYWESTQETLVGLYAKRNPKTGQPIETINDIIHRVALANAIAELKYVLTPQELIAITLPQAIAHPVVTKWATTFADNIGNQRFWANTPANINSDPAISLKVLQYWAYGVLLGLSEDEIWLPAEELSKFYQETCDTAGNDTDSCPASNSGENPQEYRLAMGKLAHELKGKGTLAACGVAYVADNLESIQEAAKVEALAAKSAMGMGLNTSTLRPWSSIIANGAAASGPDRFYEKTIAKAVEAVAQGGRRGGALIEIRNSDHPDILFFIDKKRLIPPPNLSSIYNANIKKIKRTQSEPEAIYKARVLAISEVEYGELYAQYIERQNYLKNTNVTVLAMPGFMKAVKEKRFYRTTFAGQPWDGNIYDPHQRVYNQKTGQAEVNKLTKEPVFAEYSVDLATFPEALEAARALSNVPIEITDKVVSVKSHLYAPDVFSRIIEGMRNSGEPGLAFYETINSGNANHHIYNLDTCNPCGEQFLPAGPGKDGRIYMGNCNLSSIHAAHRDFWKPDGSYDFAALKKVVAIEQRFMDNVSDISWYPIPAQNLTARLERRNGGGFAGVAEFLSRLELEFGQPEALVAVEELYRHYTQASVVASVDLATERGVYPLWEGSRFQKKNLRVRNSCMTNNAPTGTLAQAEQTSWGVDPHNGIVFSRKVRSRYVDFVAPGFKDLMQKYNAWPDSEEKQNQLMQKIRTNHKSCRGLPEVPAPVQTAFPIRVEVEPEQYIRHLAAIHRGASDYPEAFNSVSNTCSIPLAAPADTIHKAVSMAYDLGVKDITFYPDGSRTSQPVEKIAYQNYDTAGSLLDALGHKERRHVNIDETSGLTYKVRVGTPDGPSTLHVSLNHELNSPGQLIEIYAHLGKAGTLEAGLFEAVGRLASAFLQHAAEFGEEERAKAEEIIVKQLVNIQSGHPTFFKFADAEKPTIIQSPCDGLAKAIRQYRRHFEHLERTLPATNKSTVTDTPATMLDKLTNSIKLNLSASETLPSTTNTPQHGSVRTCSKCGGIDLYKIDGCTVCNDCGFSKCG